MASIRKTGLGYWLMSLAFAGLPLLTSSLVLGWLFLSKGQIEWPFAIFYLVSALAMATAFIPTTFVAILSGYLYGWPGLIGILLAYPAAAWIGRWIGQILFRYWGPELPADSKYARFLHNLTNADLSLVALARLSPVLPFAMANVLLAQIQLPTGRYLLGTMIGMLPRTVLFVWLGTQSKEILQMLQDPSQADWQNWLTLAMILLSIVGLGWIFRNAWQNVEKG
ncbi:MAG: VTT domain-containing protein, partial [Bacteroidota bacterium]